MLPAKLLSRSIEKGAKQKTVSFRSIKNVSPINGTIIGRKLFTRSTLSNKHHILRQKREMASYTRSHVPYPENEPILQYRKGTPERAALEQAINELRANPVEIPIIIGGKEIKTGSIGTQVIPHDHQHILARYHKATENEVKLAIETSLKAKEEWASMPFDHRVSIFLKAAELLSTTWRYKMLAATILGQSKNYFQAEIDCTCELIDFWRFNCHYAMTLYDQQPHSSIGTWNRVTHRPLEGFIYAITPFNFTAIGGNLPTAPALMGNTVVWKPAAYAMLSNYYVMQILQEAGLPAGVINFVAGAPDMITDTVMSHPEFAGIHYTGSTQVFKMIYKKVAQHIDNYKYYPRIVGETGGKDFVFAHASANIPQLATAIVRGAFEYAGQKCSAASRAYIPASIWPKLKATLLDQMNQVKTASPEEVDTLVNAVIHQTAFNRCKSYIEFAKSSPECEIISGGTYDDSKGYFVQPTIVVTTNPRNKLMMEEIFGPIITIYVYEDAKWTETLKECASSNQYALTGCIWAQERTAIVEADKALEDAAGNFYINDKPTGAIVGQQPFGGARGSGTNDKAGSHLNLLRWTSARTIKETFVPPSHFSYPYMKDV